MLHYRLWLDWMSSQQSYLPTGSTLRHTALPRPAASAANLRCTVHCSAPHVIIYAPEKSVIFVSCLNSF